MRLIDFSSFERFRNARVTFAAILIVSGKFLLDIIFVLSLNESQPSHTKKSTHRHPLRQARMEKYGRDIQLRVHRPLASRLATS